LPLCAKVNDTNAKSSIAAYNIFFILQSSPSFIIWIVVERLSARIEGEQTSCQMRKGLKTEEEMDSH
jgi:hypothetical protein